MRRFQRAVGQKPKIYDTDAANANARLSTQIPYIMAVSRFAHYLKAMMRDKIGSFMSRSEAERFLNRWITTTSRRTIPRRRP
jgi:type VI secretion system protein ImpC